MEDLLTVEDVAKILKLQPGTIYRLIYKKEIPVIKIGLRTYRFRQEDIMKFIESKKFCKGEQKHG